MVVCFASSIEQLPRRPSAAQDGGLTCDVRGYLPMQAGALDRNCVGEILFFPSCLRSTAALTHV